MSDETRVQRFIHALEIGRLAVWVRRALVLSAITGIGLFYFMHEFRGLATSQAMDQAQIGRELVRGNGWSTKFIRPLSIGSLRRHGRDAARSVTLDTANAPLPSLVNAAALWIPIKKGWVMKPTDSTYSGDRAIVILSMGFLICAIGVLYAIALELFDKRLAQLGCGLVLLCNTLWQYAISGLPQMLLLLLFHLTLFALIRAMKAQDLGSRVYPWLVAAGAGFALMALSHAITLWMFVPALLAAAFWFRPRGWAAAVLLASFLLLYSPWLLRNYRVCGNPAGVALSTLGMHSGYTGCGEMRGFELADKMVPGTVLRNIRSNVVSQMNRIFEYLGWSYVACVAFVSLIYAFKRPLAATFRWLLLAMWGGAVLGMAAFGLPEEQGLAANQMHLLFIPLLTCYGLAYLLVQWDRRVGFTRVSPNFQHRSHLLLRKAWIGLMFLVCSLPMICRFLSSAPDWAVRWPPYLPFSISVFNEWMKPEEIIASDMPWAVAWYADRRSLWLPMTIKEFTDLNDYKVLAAPINGLYLTPISGTINSMGDIFDGEYKSWGAMIVHNWDPKKFPLQWVTLHGSKECMFLSDHDRRKGRH